MNMKFSIIFSPVCSDEENFEISKLGTTISIKGDVFDFGFLNAGDTCPFTAIDSMWIGGDVSRIDDVIHITVRLPHGPDAPEAVRFPQPILVEQDGPIALPGDAHAD